MGHFYITEKFRKGYPGQPPEVPEAEGLGRWQAQGQHPDGRFVFWSEADLLGEEEISAWPNGELLVEPGGGSGACINEIHDGIPEADLGAMLDREIAQARADGRLTLDEGGKLVIEREILDAPEAI